MTVFTYPDGSNVDLFLGQPTPDGRVRISDHGNTVAYLLDLGLEPWSTTRRKKLVGEICQSLEVEQRGSEFLIETPYAHHETLGAIVRLGHACVRASELAMTIQGRTVSAFQENLEEFVASTDLPFEANVEVEGRYHKKIMIDFEVRGAHFASWLKSLAAGTKSTAHEMATDLFAKWHDLSHLKQSTGTERQFVTVCSFDRAAPKDEDIERLKEYSLVFTFPEQQDELREVLAA
jgi:hypothetical protein